MIRPRFVSSVIGLRVPGTPTPDLDIPIRCTSFGGPIPNFLLAGRLKGRAGEDRGCATERLSMRLFRSPGHKS
jgi:hypothetical protein